MHLHVVHCQTHSETMRLAEIRNARGLSQKALGEMIGKDASTIQRAETMHHSAKLATYIQCADALGVSLSDIFSDEMSALERQVIATFREAPPEVQERLAQMLAIAAAPLTPST
jgi:transcriptional regulator with XRE-family HTH domain